MLRSPSMRKICGDTTTPSFDSRMNQPQKMSISNFLQAKPIRLDSRWCDSIAEQSGHQRRQFLTVPLPVSMHRFSSQRLRQMRSSIYSPSSSPSYSSGRISGIILQARGRRQIYEVPLGICLLSPYSPNFNVFERLAAPGRFGPLPQFLKLTFD